MESLINNFDVTVNFWDANPNFITIKEFRQLRDADKSKKKSESSNVMWGVALIVDMHKNNILRNLSYSDKVAIVAEDYVSGFTARKYAKLLRRYEESCLTSIERSIYSLEKKLEERDTFLMSTKYCLDNAKELDTLIANTKKLKELYDTMIDELKKEEAGGGQIRGGRTESAGEKGEL